MKKLFLIPLIMMPLVAFGQSNNVLETKVWVQGNRIYYIGDISEKANNIAKRLLKKHKIDTMIIRSHGGLVSLGMDLGDLIFENKLNIQVDQYCNSSCANYIFPAGRKKYLLRNSQLIWHGGASQSIIFDKDNFLKELNNHKYRNEFIKNYRNSLERERLFLRK